MIQQLPELNRCHQGDLLDILPTWPDNFVQAIVTSPPYYLIRDYEIPPTRWPAMEYRLVPLLPPIPVATMECCLGHEPTPQDFIGHLVLVFRELQRVLRKDGVCWMNLGDNFFSDGGHMDGDCADRRGQYKIGRRPMNERRHMRMRVGMGKGLGIRPKDKMLLPHMAVMAMRADGWRVRQYNIWHKLNILPESVKDRCTTNHEYIFQLTKSERYYYDHEAIKEPVIEAGDAQDAARAFSRRRKTAGEAQGDLEPKEQAQPTMKNKRSVWHMPTNPRPEGVHFATFPRALPRTAILASTRPGDIVLDPFMGSGTTAGEAQSLGRQWLGCELGAHYFPLQEQATQRIGLL